MKKIMSILTVLMIGVLVLSGFGVAAITNSISATMDNQPPGKPLITGPRLIYPGTHEWTFKAIDPERDNVSYLIDWGTGEEYEGWTGWYASGEEVTRNHTFYKYCSVKIRAKAKDTHEAEGDWGYMDVEIPRSKQMTNPIFFQFLEQFKERFPMLRILELE